MGTERPNYMPKEEAFNEPEDFFSKSPSEISRRYCEPSREIYTGSSELRNDPFKAIESVDWLGPSLTEIDDPIEGLVVAAARLETAQRELRLAPRQRELFEGFKENIDGAIGFLGALESTLKSKVIRSVASGATVVTMALSAAGCGNAIARPIDEITPNISPATEVFTPTDSLESPTISPTITVFPNETSTPVEIWGAAYPKSAENFVKKPSISGAEARKIIVEKRVGEDLKALENWYKSEGIIGSGMSNVAVPVVYQEGGNFNWNLMVKKNNGNFLKFTITSGKEADQLVRAMGMITYLGEKPSFEVSELKDPTGMENLTQQVIWDRSGWSVIGAFQGSNLIAWFNADAPGGGEWVSLHESIITPTLMPATEVFPTETETPPAIVSGDAAKETSRYFQPEFQLDLEGTVDGITVPFTFGLHKSIVERAEEPIKTISVNRDDALERYAKFWLTICWQKYVQQNPDQAGTTFAQYEELVKKGEGEIQIAAVDETTDDQNNKILTFHPEKGFVSMLVDSSVSLPEEGNSLSSFYFGMNEKGQLIIADTYWSKELSEQRGYDGYDGWEGSTMVDLAISVQVAESIELVIATDNKALISQRPYWRVAGQVSLPNTDLFLDPTIYDIQVSERSPLLTIQK